MRAQVATWIAPPKCEHDSLLRNLPKCTGALAQSNRKKSHENSKNGSRSPRFLFMQILPLLDCDLCRVLALFTLKRFTRRQRKYLIKIIRVLQAHFCMLSHLFRCVFTLYRRFRVNSTRSNALLQSFWTSYSVSTIHRRNDKRFSTFFVGVLF